MALPVDEKDVTSFGELLMSEAVQLEAVAR